MNTKGHPNGVLKKVSATTSGTPADFDILLADWLPLACAVNSINRGMGLLDLYPFVITGAAIEKLRFIHTVIAAEAHRPRVAGSQKHLINQLETVG